MTNPHASNWRDIGDTTATVYRDEFARVESSLLPHAQAMWEAARPHSALALAHMWMENQFSTTGHIIRPEHNNPMALRPGPGIVVWHREFNGTNPYLAFNSPVDCVREWKRRINDPTYKADSFPGGAYTSTTTLTQYLSRYAPAGDVHPVTGKDNVDIGYEGTVRTVLRRLAIAEGSASSSQEGTPVALKAHQAVGLSKPLYLPDDIVFERKIIPASHTNVRSNRKRSASDVTRVTRHETANFNAGANADMHYRYLMSNPSPAAGYNTASDDRKVIHLTPFDEDTWAAGTPSGNRTSDHNELCVNSDINHARARRIAICVDAAILYARGLPVSALVQHNFWTGKNCPMLIRQNNLWSWYVAEVGKQVAAIKAHVEGGGSTPSPAPAPASYGDPVPVPGIADLAEFVRKVGHPITVVDFKVQTTKKTPRFQTAGGTGRIGPDIDAGATFDVMAEYTSGQDKWYITPYWTRVRAADTKRV